MKLDDKDRELLAALTGNARIKNRDLARRVGLSPSACLARVRRLERSGVIAGYRAVIGRSGSGERFEGWADIRLVDPPSELVDEFLRMVTSAPEVVEAHRIAGHYDYMVRICTGDITSWNSFRRRLDAIGGVVHSRFSILLEPLK